jgi:hypothetical protein
MISVKSEGRLPSGKTVCHTTKKFVFEPYLCQDNLYSYATSIIFFTDQDRKVIIMIQVARLINPTELPFVT